MDDDRLADWDVEFIGRADSLGGVIELRHERASRRHPGRDCGRGAGEPTLRRPAGHGLPDPAGPLCGGALASASNSSV